MAVDADARFTPYTAIPAEGARVVVFTCLECGAAVLLHPADADLNPLELHAAWHDRLMEEGE